jgi:hypothetical protein
MSTEAQNTAYKHHDEDFIVNGYFYVMDAM